jgi:hypothetical protein
MHTIHTIERERDGTERVSKIRIEKGDEGENMLGVVVVCIGERKVRVVVKRIVEHP